MCGGVNFSVRILPVNNFRVVTTELEEEMDRQEEVKKGEEAGGDFGEWVKRVK
jgi:hypothetical protein